MSRAVRRFTSGFVGVRATSTGEYRPQCRCSDRWTARDAVLSRTRRASGLNRLGLHPSGGHPAWDLIKRPVHAHQPASVQPAHPTPALIRVKGLAILPNRVWFDVRECFVIVGGFGDLALERADLRGETLTYVRADGGDIGSLQKPMPWARMAS